MKINPLVLFIPIPLLLGSLIGNIGRPDKWYNNKLKKPELNPPNYIFPIVWTTLYLMIGISYYLALSKTKDIKNWILPILHLLLNFSYSPMFFYFRELLLSSILTTLILITGLMIIYQFSILDKSLISTYLLIPYIIWLCFANYLSWSIYFIN
jgi:tryptophan-rich sensory protein